MNQPRPPQPALDDVRRAVGLLAWAALAAATGWILEGFAVSGWGPNPRFFRPASAGDTTLWSGELTFDPASPAPIAVVLRSGAVLHVLGRPKDAGQMRLVRVSMQASLPSGLYRIDPDDPRLHAEPLHLPDEAQSEAGNAALGGWLTLNLQALRERLPGVDHWTFFTLGGARGASATGSAIVVMGDWLSTRNAAIAITLLLSAAGMVTEKARGGPVASLGRAARLALLLPAWIAALVALDRAPGSTRLGGAIGITLAVWAGAFTRRYPRIDPVTLAVALVAPVALAYLVHPYRAAAPAIPSPPAETAAGPPRPLRVLCLGQFSAASSGTSPARWDLYPVVAERVLAERFPDRAVQVIDLRGALDPMQAFHELGERVGALRADVVSLEIATRARRVAWLPAPVTMLLDLVDRHGPGARAALRDAQPIGMAIRAIRTAGAQVALVVPPDPETFLSCDPSGGTACGRASELAHSALESQGGFYVDESSLPLRGQAWRVEPFLDGSGTLNRWGEEQIGRDLAAVVVASQTGS